MNDGLSGLTSIDNEKETKGEISPVSVTRTDDGNELVNRQYQGNQNV